MKNKLLETLLNNITTTNPSLVKILPNKKKFFVFSLILCIHHAQNKHNVKYNLAKYIFYLYR